MDELQPNPDDCGKFEPNQFKQEKCKHCSRSWTEHKGVISEEYLQKFLQKKLQVQEEKEKKEAEAQQAAAAKKLAKKRASQAAEDDWLFGERKEPEPDSDDDMGFRMLLGSEIAKPQAMQPVSKELKVVNLIDWGECDVADQELPGGEATGSSSSTRAPALEARAELYTPGRGDLGFQDTVSQLSSTGPAFQSGSQDLLTEIQHLRQMLADANEEKAIQVAIIQDEVTEKQEKIHELEALLREARLKVDSVDEKEPIGHADPAEAERLRARLPELEAKLEEKEQAGNADPAEAERLKARLSELEAKLEEVQRGHDPAEAERLKAHSFELEAKLEAAEARWAAEGAAAVEGSQRIEDALVVVSEVRELCNRTYQVLEDSPGEPSAESCSSGDLQGELGRCRTSAHLAVGAAERLASERRQLMAKLEELERERRPTPATTAQEAQAAKALRDIRLHAEQQLAWVLQRMSVSHSHQAELQKLGS
ncbi:unnamed protein product [Durusdinium trenchii]|uniref:Uncharacterized protein n=1 Tax=Durusdinium trenchii TaxID=1381693 RepID=A0ABP0KWG7_9DINO